MMADGCRMRLTIRASAASIGLPEQHVSHDPPRPGPDLMHARRTRPHSSPRNVDVAHTSAHLGADGDAAHGVDSTQSRMVMSLGPAIPLVPSGLDRDRVSRPDVATLDEHVDARMGSMPSY